MWRCLVVVAHQLPRALGMEWDSVGCLHFGLHRSQFSYGLSVNFIWLQFQHSNVSIYCIACRSSCSASLLALTDQHAGAGKPKLKPRFQICLVSPKPSQNQLKTNNQNRNNTAAYTDPWSCGLLLLAPSPWIASSQGVDCGPHWSLCCRQSHLSWTFCSAQCSSHVRAIARLANLSMQDVLPPCYKRVEVAPLAAGLKV